MQHIVASAGVSPAVKGLLIASHFDAGLGSPGASDAASCIGVMLEMAHALAADGNSTLAAPVVFLFNGGEETLSQVGSATAQHCIALHALRVHEVYRTLVTVCGQAVRQEVQSASMGTECGSHSYS